MKSHVRLEGFRELEAALFDLKTATARNVALRALSRAVKPMHAEAVRLAPDDPATGGWDLHSSVRIGTKATRGSGYRKLSPVEVLMGPRIRHQHLVEFGTAKMPAQPFMRPAWDNGKDRALRDVRAYLSEEIDKAVARAAKRSAREAAKLTRG
jgi:HK97 gp10 family phage protein